MLCVCVGDVMDVVSVCIVRHEEVLVYGKSECF